MVSNLLFTKDQTSKVTKGELQMLYSGLEDEIRRSQAGIPFQLVQTNPGYHLIWMFYSRRDCLLRNENKKDRCGSLLTPLFKHFGINLRAYVVNYNIEYVDTPYLISCHILHDETTYRFMDKEGNVLFFKLPQPNLTNFSSIENIRFLPDPEFRCADPRAPPPDDEMDEPEDITPDKATPYDLGPLDDDADAATYRRLMVDSQRKNNSLMKRSARRSREVVSVVRSPGHPGMSRLRSNHIARAKNRLELPWQERIYRGTGGQLVAPRAGSHTDPATSPYLIVYPSEL
ncbi:hypothetical protein DY000_02014873 [Brassica cretica]|uniref:Arabidopsis retrotransposon Orf1 C-terminal domain-containing protein n=1 Tax=Brassica cretica TaxID=69181 RepID=A0ABQ7CVM1_BRACR|nr:hypothetical protein DY000_02014873 [Brassica cretica]